MGGEYIPDDDDNFSEGVDPVQMPPPPPGMGKGGQPSFNPGMSDMDMEPIEIDDSRSQLASTPGKNILLIGIALIASGIFLYTTVFSETDEEKKQKEVKEIIAKQPEPAAVDPAPAVEISGGAASTISTDLNKGLEDIELPPPPPVAPVLNEDMGDIGDVGEKVFIEEVPNQPLAGATPSKAEIAASVTPVPAAVTPVTPATPVAPAEQGPALPPAATTTPAPVGPTPEELAAIEMNRRRGSMVITGKGGMPSSLTAFDPTSLAALNQSVSLTHTSAEQVTAEYIGNTDMIIAQGKIIEAVLETAITTEIGGMVRAIVARDIYAESGRYILIPKGSRLVGTYGDVKDRSSTRIAIGWTRVIRPDGVDVAIASPGTDQLGRAGIAGFVDNKYFEIFSNSILLSAVTVGGSILVDAINGGESTTTSTTTSASGDTTNSQSGTATDLAVLQGVRDMGDVAGDIASDILDTDPVIIVQQGTRLNVFVNKDLRFPESTLNAAQYIR